MQTDEKKPRRQAWDFRFDVFSSPSPSGVPSGLVRTGKVYHFKALFVKILCRISWKCDILVTPAGSGSVRILKGEKTI